MNLNRITYIREDLDKSQRELANLLNVSKSTIASWETKKNSIPICNLIELCNLSKYSMDFALGLSNDKTKISTPYILNYEIIGNNVRIFRLKNNLSQREFAKSLNTTQKTVYRIENAHAIKITSFLFEFAKTYNISLENIIR